MRYLVTGGAGFIGSHLVEALLATESEVVVLDNLSTGRTTNLEPVAQNPKLVFVEGSTNDFETVKEVAKDVDGIFHLAASVGVRRIMAHLVESIENNIRGTENVLRVANESGTKVLLTSTSEVYGRSNSGEPFQEGDDLQMGPTLKTRWSYACAKALDEYLGFAYWREFGLPVTAVRLFNTVGERQLDAYGMVLPTFVREALAGEPLTIHGSGDQSRCFCHVSDVVRALIQLMQHPTTVGEVYNLGSDHEVTINELADLVISTTGSKSNKVFVPYDQAFAAGFDDINRRVPDVSKVKALLDWEPTLSLDDIISRLAEDVSMPAAV